MLVESSNLVLCTISVPFQILRSPSILSTFNAADVGTWQGRSLLAVHFHGFERVVMEAIYLSLGVRGLRNSLIQNGLSSRARISNPQKEMRNTRLIYQ
jgi:hypothetical protein